MRHPGRFAHKAVYRAVVRGELAPATSLPCTDCGQQATDYDHRDYRKPLDVQPVCRRCNGLRGTAMRDPHPPRTGSSCALVVTTLAVNVATFDFIDFGDYEMQPA
jgi:hypothetical protein